MFAGWTVLSRGQVTFPRMAFRPVIYDRREAGLSPAPGAAYGELGAVTAITFHHSAGPRARTKRQAKELHAAFQAQHQRQYESDDIGYHFSLDDHGRVYRLRPLSEKGTHVGRANTGNVGFMVHGNYDRDRLTWRQRRTLRWLFDGGFRQLGIPYSAGTVVRGHQEWPGHGSNACPGGRLMRHVRWLRNRRKDGAR
jgi:hypothetical protein